MTWNRITKHPILEIPKRKIISFTWNGQFLKGLDGEMISSALIANGIHIFGHHPIDNSPQGIFCANGQCSQCLVIVNDLPVKSCMIPLAEGMDIHSVEGLPQLPLDDFFVSTSKPPVMDTDVLIVGGGPAGLSATIELGKLGVATLLVDDKDRLGGKLVLQTHKFFGSVEDSYAGTRGFEIGKILENKLLISESVDIWLNTTAVGVFSDGIVGVVKNGSYRMIRPKKLLVATGARERMLPFPGNTLPGIYGAGAFQTLVNRDLIKSSSRILIVGGGNVGLISGYHAIQAGIEVVALIEALPKVSGYKVHADKLVRLGIPILTGHSVASAHGTDSVESVTIAKLDKDFKIIPNTGKTYEVDTVLVAVGLAEVNEFYHKAKKWNMDVFSAGDAQEIAEASAAMFTGKIESFKIAKSLGLDVGDIPRQWDEKASILKSKPGKAVEIKAPEAETGVFPIFHCFQEVPCNPCSTVCPIGAIHTEKDEITGLPYRDETEECTGCLNCVAICPGLAITLVDYRKDKDYPSVTFPFEVGPEKIVPGQVVQVTGQDGVILGNFPVEKIKIKKKYQGTLLVQIKMDKKFAKQAAGILVQTKQYKPFNVYEKLPLPDEAIICRCERVKAGEIRSAIQNGVHDMNQLKAITRAGMGACGSKTCRPMIWRIFREEGIDLDEVTVMADRPLFIEVPIGYFAGVEGEDDHI